MLVLKNHIVREVGPFPMSSHIIVTKILRKILATTFMENYGKLRMRGVSAWDERMPLPS